MPVSELPATLQGPTPSSYCKVAGDGMADGAGGEENRVASQWACHFVLPSAIFAGRLMHPSAQSLPM
jgi:hypothetical protein